MKTNRNPWVGCHEARRLTHEGVVKPPPVWANILLLLPRIFVLAFIGAFYMFIPCIIMSFFSPRRADQHTDRVDKWVNNSWIFGNRHKVIDKNYFADRIDHAVREKFKLPRP